MTETDETAPERDEPAIIAERRAKLARLRESGVEPFPHEFPDRVEIATVRAEHDGLEDGEETESSYRVAGGSPPTATWGRSPSSTSSTARARSSSSRARPTWAMGTQP